MFSTFLANSIYLNVHKFVLTFIQNLHVSLYELPRMLMDAVKVVDSECNFIAQPDLRIVTIVPKRTTKILIKKIYIFQFL